MRSLAEFIMKGRRQAIIAVVLIGLIPPIYFISPVLVGLIILRKGPKEAAPIVLWALLPIAAWALYPIFAGGAPGNLLPILVLLTVSALAIFLRYSESWQLTVLLTVIVSLLTEFYLRIQPETVNILLDQFNPLLEQNGEGAQITRGEMIAAVATIHSGMCVLLLMWSRWMQAMLFNPGGFKAEFHSLRIEWRAALILAVLILLSGLGNIVPSGWVFYFAMPLVFSGTALVHATIALKQLSVMWLFLYYAVISVIVQFVILLAMIDSWFNFRKSMQPST